MKYDEGLAMTDPADGTVIIDCDRCVVRPHACSDCVVSVLLGSPRQVEWDESEHRAVNALAEAGMVPRLRLVSELRDVTTSGDRRVS